VLWLGVACGPAGSGSGAVADRGTEARRGRDAGLSTDERPEPTAESLDLTSVVRLAATDPVLQPLMLWPREAEDSIAAARDDWPGSSWKAPAGGSFVELDLLPLAGRPVSLESLSVLYDGEPPASLALTLLESCGGAGGQFLGWPDPAARMGLAGRRAGCLRLDAEADAPYVVKGLSLIVHDSLPALPELPLPAVPVAAVHPSSGVVEGFYGIPWSWRERRAMVVHLARSGLGIYIHAPKNDPRHRAEWRQPYTPEEMARFGELAALGEEVGVRVRVGISPFVDWGPDATTDLALLAGKLADFQGVGVRGFVLLADDIEFEVDLPVDGAMGAQHAAIANGLLARLLEVDESAGLWFVPTVYSDERADQWEGGLDYLAALAELDPAIEVMWTGPGTSNATLAAADFERVTTVVGRPPVLWENYWANDGGDGFVGRLPLAPYVGRAPAVATTVRGVVVNPLIEGALSRLVVTSAAGYLELPEGRPPEEARRLAAQAELPFTGGAAADAGRDAELLELLQALFDADTQGSPGWHQMESAIASLSARLRAPGKPPAAEVAALLPMFARLVTLGSEVRRSGLTADLDDELVYPLLKVRRAGEAGLFGLLALGDRLAGRVPSPWWTKAEVARTQLQFCRFTFSLGKIEGLLDAIAAVAPDDLGGEAYACAAAFPPCRAGEELEWSPCGACPGLAVAGLPGGSVVGGLVRWTPRLAGRYLAVATCSGPQGWGAGIEEVHCEP
jgi:hypothetical protein